MSEMSKEERDWRGGLVIVTKQAVEGSSRLVY